MEFSVFSVSLGCALIWVAWKMYCVVTDPLRKIPGPSGLPFLGNALQLSDGKIHTTFMDMAKRYGPLFKISIFSDQQLVVNSFDLIWEVIVTKSHEFSGRPPSVRGDFLAEDNLFLKSGKEMTIRKKMLMKAMKNYGSGLGEMEGLLSSACEDFIASLENKVGTEVDMVKELTTYVCTITGTLIYGKKFDPESRTVKGMTDLTYKVLQAVSPVDNNVELESFPWLRYVPIWNNRYIRAEQALEDLKNRTCRVEMKKAFSEYEAGNVQNDGLIYKIIHAVRTELDENGKQLVPDTFVEGMLMDMLGGGIETTSRTMTQLLLELRRNTEVIKRLQQEIDDVIGRNRQPKLSDRSNMPYANAVMYEIQRLISIGATMPHKTVTDTTLGGYQIPKNTPVLVNFWAVNHEEEVFPDPYSFKPERFLNPDGSLKEAGEAVRKRTLAFGGGARVCVGELFAKSRMFLTITSLLQKFDMEFCDRDIDCDVQNYRTYLLIETPRHVRIIFRLRE